MQMAFTISCECMQCQHELVPSAPCCHQPVPPSPPPPLPPKKHPSPPPTHTNRHAHPPTHRDEHDVLRRRDPSGRVPAIDHDVVQLQVGRQACGVGVKCAPGVAAGVGWGGGAGEAGLGGCGQDWVGGWVRWWGEAGSGGQRWRCVRAGPCVLQAVSCLHTACSTPPPAAARDFAPQPWRRSRGLDTVPQ